MFSQGIVSAIPLIKDRAYLRAAPLTKILAVTQKCLPVIALGLLRTLSVKGTEYPVRHLPAVYLCVFWIVSDRSD